YCTIRLIFLSRSHSGVVVLMLDHGLTMASTSPRSSASEAEVGPAKPVTTLNLVPMSVLSRRRNTTDDEVGPVPATITSRFLASSMVRMPEAAQVWSTSTLELIRPTQVNLRASYWMPGVVPSTCPTATVCETKPITVPSCAATL